MRRLRAPGTRNMLAEAEQNTKATAMGRKTIIDGSTLSRPAFFPKPAVALLRQFNPISRQSRQGIFHAAPFEQNAFSLVIIFESRLFLQHPHCPIGNLVVN